MKELLACMRVVGGTDYVIVLWCFFLCRDFILRCQCFAGKSIHFFPGEFLALADVLFLGEVMPNFSGEIHVHICSNYVLLGLLYRAGDHGPTTGEQSPRG